MANVLNAPREHTRIKLGQRHALPVQISSHALEVAKAWSIQVIGGSPSPQKQFTHASQLLPACRLIFSLTSLFSGGVESACAKGYHGIFCSQCLNDVDGIMYGK